MAIRSVRRKPCVKHFSHFCAPVEPVEPRLLFAGSPLSSAPALSSFPGAPATLYLDLHGEAQQNWGMATVPAIPAYDIDGDPTTFSAQELSNIQLIWQRVAEAYSPFNVNVTTVDPGSWNLTGMGQNYNRFRVVIGGSGSWTGVVQGGTASVGSYYTPGLPNTAYVFPTQLANDPMYVGDEAAHEAGHGFGLQHQSVYSGTVQTAVYNPGNSSTAPFMGNPLRAGIRATWWYGPNSLGYDMIQDDLATIGGSVNGFGFRTVSTGQSATSSTPLSVAGNSVSGAGIIELTSQHDYYSFNVPVTGSATFNVNVAPFGAMLHAILEIHNASDGTLASAASATTLGQTLTVNLPAGTYYAVVKSFGQYGDVGQYTLTGQLTPQPATVLGRYTFYNGSAFDGRNPAANPTDDAAIATDKQPLLPGNAATFANFTSYSAGLNGVMIDVANLRGTPILSDFTFSSGATANPATWSPAPAPNALLIRPGAGALGSTRIEFTWANGTLTNRWLQVTTKADANTGLSAPDVFYFGNLIAFAGEAPVNGLFTVTNADLQAARNDLHNFLNPALITNPHDYSRDGRVDATDQIIAQLQINAASSLPVITAPAAPTLVSAAPVPAAAPDTTVQSPSRPLDLSTLIDGEGIRPRTRHRKRPAIVDPTPSTPADSSLPAPDPLAPASITST